jgi:hypothetical protein
LKNLEIIGGIIALLTYIPLGLLVKKEPKIHSFASWAMFAVLDYITAWMLWSEGGNWLLVLFLALGCTSISILLLYARAVRWGAFESFTLLLVFLVCIVWIFYGNTIGAIAGIIANVTAGAPQFKDSWKIPDVRLVPIWFLFVIANTCVFFAGEGWGREAFIEERLYPLFLGLFGMAMSITTLISLKKKNRTSLFDLLWYVIFMRSNH